MKRPDVTWLSSPPVARRMSGLRRLGMIVMVGLLLVLLSYQSSAAQATGLQTQNLNTAGVTAESMAQALVGSGGGVTISDAVFTGAKVSAGTFSGGADIIGFESGIILSTGNIASVAGPNNAEDSSTINSSDPSSGDADLTALATGEGQTGTTYDAAVLTFSFVPNGDHVYFDFVFASEEYPEYVHSDYNDVFAFYVNGTNCALVNDQPVSINTINNANPKESAVTRPPNVAVNPELYIDNSPSTDGSSPRNTQMDGLTRVLTCAAPVNRGVENTLKLAIADTGDSKYDSNVFIRAGSLTTIEPTATPILPTVTPVPPTPVPPAATPVATVVTKTNTIGDVHISTPDGLIYDFQEVGDYILTQSSSGDVKVQARQAAPATNPQVSVNTAAALWVAGDKLEFYVLENTFYINDELTPLPTGTLALPAGGRIEVASSVRPDFTIYWPDGNTGARVILYPASHIDIGVGRLGGSLTYEGVIGNLDRNAQNDMQVRNGDLITPPATAEQLKIFGDSWRVPVEESLFADPRPVDAAAAAQEPLTLLDMEPAARAAAQQTCQSAGVSDPSALHMCTYDVAATGDEGFVASAQTYQEAVAQLPAAENVTVAAVQGQRLEIGQQYAVPDVPGTFRYFQLTELPAEAGDPAILALCPDLQTGERVFVADILTSEAAVAQGLTATNEPCTPVDVAQVTETTDEATPETTEAAAPETTDEAVAETTAETTDETAETSETPAEVAQVTETAPPAAEEPETSADTAAAAPETGGGGFCNGILAMPLGLGLAFMTLNRRRKQ
jgi:hypothetical protein